MLILSIFSINLSQYKLKIVIRGQKCLFKILFTKWAYKCYNILWETLSLACISEFLIEGIKEAIFHIILTLYLS